MFVLRFEAVVGGQRKPSVALSLFTSVCQVLNFHFFLALSSNLSARTRQLVLEARNTTTNANEATRSTRSSERYVTMPMQFK